MAKTILWRLHCASPPERLWEMLTTDAGRASFWAERSASAGPDRFTLSFAMGVEAECRVLEAEAPRLFAFCYFSSEVRIALTPDGKGGTDLTLVNSGVAEADYEEMLPGWLNVLLPLKAAADFGVDLRNHDSGRSWRERYVDQ